MTSLVQALPFPLQTPFTETQEYYEDPESRPRARWITGESEKYSGSQKLTEAADELRDRSIRWHKPSGGKGFMALQHGPLPHLSAENLNSISQISAESFNSILHKCSKGGKAGCALQLQAEIQRHGYLSDPSAASQLILKLVDCGCMHLAEQVFDELRYWDTVSLSIVIKTVIRLGEPHAGLILYSKVDDFHHLQFDSHTFIELLKVCAEFRYVEQGCKLHTHIRVKGLLQSDAAVGNSLVSMYAKCNELSRAKDVFDDLPLRNAVSWNTLIAGYAKQGRGVEALRYFKKMREEGFLPSVITYICTLKACCNMGDIGKGQEIHAEVARQGLLKQSDHLCSTLLDMYAKCGSISKAHEVFNSMTHHNVIAWNTLITGYNEDGQGIKALECIEQMQVEGISPDAFTYSCSLKACGISQAIDTGLALHAEVFKSGLLERDYMIGSALIDMYGKVGLLAKAQGVFDNLPFRDVISWTSLIAGYAEHGPEEDALSCFDKMQSEGIFPNAVTYLCCLKACSSLGAIAKGSEIHIMISKEGHLEKDLLVGSTLVDMYAKCGSLHKAEDVFGKLSTRDVISWNALLAGYALAGKAEQLFNCYDSMQIERTKPNSVTFTIVLSACNHLGLVERALDYCRKMIEDFSITPTIDHLSCMVDLLGRTGLLEKLVAIMNSILVAPDRVVWLAVLSACRKWKNVEVGRWAFEQALQLNYKDPSVYVCMSMIYVAAGMQEDANKVEASRVKNQAWNVDIESCLWMDSMGFLHKFTKGNRHFLSDNVHLKLTNLSYQLNSEMDVDVVAKDDMTPDCFCEHNERFAVVFALINTSRTPIHVKKNARICEDCHVTMAFISEIEQRKIIVEDINYHHIFLKGKCSCKDYW